MATDYTTCLSGSRTSSGDTSRVYYSGLALIDEDDDEECVVRSRVSSVASSSSPSTSSSSSRLLSPNSHASELIDSAWLSSQYASSDTSRLNVFFERNDELLDSTLAQIEMVRTAKYSQGVGNRKQDEQPKGIPNKPRMSTIMNRQPSRLIEDGQIVQGLEGFSEEYQVCVVNGWMLTKDAEFDRHPWQRELAELLLARFAESRTHRLDRHRLAWLVRWIGSDRTLWPALLEWLDRIWDDRQFHPFASVNFCFADPSDPPVHLQYIVRLSATERQSITIATVHMERPNDPLKYVHDRLYFIRLPEQTELALCIVRHGKLCASLPIRDIPARLEKLADVIIPGLAKHAEERMRRRKRSKDQECGTSGSAFYFR